MKLYFEKASFNEDRKMLMPILSKAAGSGKVFRVTYSRSGYDYRGGRARYDETCYFIPTEANKGYVKGQACTQNLNNHFHLPSIQSLTIADFIEELTFYSFERSLRDVQDTGIVL